MRTYILITVLMTLIITGCGPNRFLVETNYIQDENYDVKPNITKTNSYHALFNDIKSIAIKAPDNCSNETESQKTGEAKSITGIISCLTDTERRQMGRILEKLRDKAFDELGLEERPIGPPPLGKMVTQIQKEKDSQPE